MLRIGSLKLDIPVVGAPLSGYSDLAMRSLNREYGAPLVFAGLMLDKSAAHPKVIKRKDFQPGENEHPVGAQIHGTEPAVMANAARLLEENGYDVIDLNFACPAKKVLSRGRGGALLKNPEKVLEIYRAVREVVKCPVTVKLRSGYERSDESLEKFWEIVERLVNEGIDAITIHGRSVGQKYRGKANWEILKEVKGRFGKAVIIGSGDLFEPVDCIRKMKESGLDGISIARGAIGNPWIFRDLRALLEGKELPEPPSLAEQGDVVMRHIEMVLGLFLERKAVGYFRKFAARYCAGHPERKKAAMDIMKSKSVNELIEAVKKWYLV